MCMPSVFNPSANKTMAEQAKADFRAGALTAGRYDLLLPEYVDPLMLYLPGEPPQIAGGAQIEAFFRTFRSGLDRHGAARFAALVTAEDLPTRDRSRLWTDWFAEIQGQPRQLIARTVCYRRMTGGTTRTEMVEFTYLDTPFLTSA